MTEQEKTAYWYKWHKFQQRYEKIFIPHLRRALNDQVEASINTYNQTINTDGIPSTPVYRVLIDLYKTTGVQWAAKVANTLPKKKARLPMGFTERIVELMRTYYGIDLLNDAEGITQTTKEYIADVLAVAAEKGWSFDEIVKNLRNTELNQKRARLIARTETVTAANGAAKIYAKETGLDMNKTWIAVRDKRTRDAHRAIDNVMVDIDTPFNLEGVTMQQPGDRTQENGLAVPAALIINCRCCAAFTVKD